MIEQKEHFHGSDLEKIEAIYGIKKEDITSFSANVNPLGISYRLREGLMEHIDAMDDLRQGIRLRAYAQTNPVDAYKKESLEMFEEMISAIQEETVRRLYSVRIQRNEEIKRERVAKGMTENVGGDGTVKKQPKKVVKIGRNDLCPCGSGLKWKKCDCKEYHS